MADALPGFEREELVVELDAEHVGVELAVVIAKTMSKIFITLISTVMNDRDDRGADLRR